MKRLISSALILVLLLALTAPALAISKPESWYEEENYLGYTFDEGTDTTVYEAWKLHQTDYDSDISMDEYCVFANDTVFTFSNNAPAGGDDYIRVYLKYYARMAPGQYRYNGYGEEQRLDSNGKISMVDDYDPDANPPYMHIMPGQSFSVTGADLLAAEANLPDGGAAGDYMVMLMVEHRYPTSDDSWSINTYFKHDENKTAKLRAGESLPPSFSDVASSDYFFDSVNWAVEKGVTNGTSDTTFSPAKTCTQEQIITFLYRAMSSPAVSAASPYSDVKEDAYYYDSARWAYEKGLRTGGAFGVGSHCTRSDVVLYLWMLAGRPAMSASGPFADVSPDATYAQAVTWAVANGVTDGISDTAFGPDQTCTRGQIVTFLFRALVK